MYDVLESDVHKNGVNGSRYAEKGYLGKFVCLNEKGKLQARAMGEHIKHIGLPIGYVISSPICRARQTAEIAFNRYDKGGEEYLSSTPHSSGYKYRDFWPWEYGCGGNV